MFKFISLLFIFIIISCCGFMYAEVFTKREMQLKAILKILLSLKNEIVYLSVPLEEALLNIGSKADEPFKNLIKAMREDLQKNEADSVYEIVKEEYKKIDNELYLKENDIKILADLFKGLGESGVYGQEALMNMTEQEIKINIAEAEEISKKNVKLYRYLGICIGAMVVIFLI